MATPKEWLLASLETELRSTEELLTVYADLLKEEDVKRFTKYKEELQDKIAELALLQDE
jgi:hypothetical protein